MKYLVPMIIILLFVYLVAKSAGHGENKRTSPIAPAPQKKVFNDGWPIWIPM